MAVCTERTALLELETPRPSLSSLYARPDATCSGEVSMCQAFLNVFRKSPKLGATDEIRDVVVDLTTRHGGPDVVIKADNQPFRGHIILEGVVPRVAEVQMTSSLSNMSCHFPQHATGQVVTMRVITHLGTLKVGFPRDFDGFVVFETCLGGTYRCEDFERHCVVSDAPAHPTFASVTYRVRPEQPNKKVKFFEKQPVDTEKYDSSKHNYCKLRSINGNVKVGYVDEMNIFGDDL